MRRLLMPALALMVTIGLAAKARADDQAKAIVENAIKAHGGLELLNKYKGGHTKSKGRLEILGGADFTQELFWALPDKFKELAEIEIMGQKINTETVVNGDKAVIRANGMEIAVTDDIKKALKEGREAMEVAQLKNLLQKEFKLSSLGEAKVEGKPAVGVKVSKDGQKDIDLYFDKETNLMVKLDRTGTDPMTGNEIREERIILEYKKTAKGPEVKRILLKRDGNKFLELEVLEVKMLETIDENQFSIR